jgi:glycosyltransferase involved in cell wall biosynthesis
VTLRSFLTPYARHFRDLGWTVEAAASGALDDPAVLDTYDRVHDLPLSRSLLQARRNIHGFARLTRLVGSGFDIVHVHTPIAGFLLRAAARRVPGPGRPAIVYTAHGFHFHHDGRPWTNALFLAAERVAGRWTDRLVVINREDEMAARSHRIVPPERLVYMPGIGIDTAHYARSAIPSERVTEARSALGLQPEIPFVVVVGELNRNKRPGDVLRALPQMRHSETHLAFLGEGTARSSLEDQARTLGIADRVRFMGNVPDVRPYILGSAVLVLASQREGLPRSIMEALSLETPVVASAARGSRDLVGPDAGWLVPIGDVAALAQALDAVLDDPAEARARVQQGRARMVREHDIARLLAMHESLYTDLLATRRR